MALVPTVRIYYPRCLVVLSVLFEGDPKPATYKVVPRSVKVERNSARKADTATIELDYRDFPMDPRAVRSILVSVHIEALKKASAPMIASRLNARFFGLCDEPHTTLGMADQTVSLECRDYTGIWLDQRWPGAIKRSGSPPVPSLPTPPGFTLGDLVRGMWSQVVPLTLPPLFVGTAATAEALDVSVHTGRTEFVSEEDDNAWDVLSALLDRFGLVPVYTGDQLEIRSPTHDQAGSAFMVYGRNVERLDFYRNLQRKKGKQVKIVAWNPILGQSFEAVWPTTQSLIASGDAEKLGTDEKPTVKVDQVQYNIEGNLTDAQLVGIAKSVHAELASSELLGELETRDMADLFDGSVLGLTNGDILFVSLDPDDKAGIVGMSPGDAIKHLSDPLRPNPMSVVVATALVQSWDRAQQLSAQFYVLEAHHEWDHEDGYRFRVKFRDFILGV